MHELSCRGVTELLPLNFAWGVNTGRGGSLKGCVHEVSCREVTELLPLNISWGVNTGRGESLKGTNVLSTPIHIAVIFMKQDDAICCFPVLSEWILLPQCRVLDLCNQFVRHLSMPTRRCSKVINEHMSHLMLCIYSNLLTHLLCTCSRSFFVACTISYALHVLRSFVFGMHSFELLTY